MKNIFTILLITITFNISCTENDPIKQIREQFKFINNQTDYVTIELNNEDFLDFSPDNGALLKGFYKNDTLYKIVESVGLSFAQITTEYYLWDNQLFFAYHFEKEYPEIYDNSGDIIGLDYTSPQLKYESRYYYANEKEIRQLEKGERLMILENPDNYTVKIQPLISLLNNKNKYQKEYNKMQGKWISNNDALYVLEFDGMTKIEYYDKEYVDQFRIKIENTYLYCTTMDEEKLVDKYEIMSLTDTELTLLYLPVGRILTLNKINDM